MISKMLSCGWTGAWWPKSKPQLYHIVQIAGYGGLRFPCLGLYWMIPSMNAFATGSIPQNAAVAATTDLLAVIDREIGGVIGFRVSIPQFSISTMQWRQCHHHALTWWPDDVVGRGRSQDDDREVAVVYVDPFLACHRLAPLTQRPWSS